MTKADAINLLRLDSRGSIQQHREQIAVLFQYAKTLQQSFKITDTPRNRKATQFFYLKTLAKIDAHLMLIDR